MPAHDSGHVTLSGDPPPRRLCAMLGMSEQQSIMNIIMRLILVSKMKYNDEAFIPIFYLQCCWTRDSVSIVKEI